MRVVISGVYQPALTFLIHLIIIDWIWKLLEINTIGRTDESWADTSICVLICLYITWILKN